MKTTAFASIPWALEGFMKALKNESDEVRKARIMMETIGSFKVFWCWWGIYQRTVSDGPSELVFQWSLNLGMTEVGGTI